MTNAMTLRLMQAGIPYMLVLLVDILVIPDLQITQAQEDGLSCQTQHFVEEKSRGAQACMENCTLIISATILLSIEIQPQLQINAYPK